MSAVMDTVYNNYLSTYSPMQISRFDSHKKSELRSVYNSIVKLNNESPLYLPVTQKSTQLYAVDLKENARQLHNTVASLGGDEDAEILNQRTAYSSNNDVVTATYIGNLDNDGLNPEFNIEVTQLATPQENLGTFLKDDKVALKPDTYSFDVAINDTNYEFQFSVDSDEKNVNVQNRLAKLINNANVGLYATVVYGDDSKTALNITSEQTGTAFGRDYIFKISDNNTSKTSGAVDYFGLDYVSHPPTNSNFLINGEERTASSNHFTVGKQFEIELQGVSEEGNSTTVGIKTDVESLADNITNFAMGYNSFIKAVSTYFDSQPKSSKLISEMTGITNLYKNELTSHGISINDDGTMSVDKDELTESANASSDVLSDFDFMNNFSNRLLDKTDQISLDPMNYVEKTVVAYKNPGHNFTSPYTSSAYTGMMFNYYC